MNMPKAPEWLTQKPIAHRGLHDPHNNIIENSQSAFLAAIKHGYAIECDLQLSSDNIPIVFHDENLDRLTDEKGLVKQKNAEDLCSIRLKGSTDTLLTLETLLDVIDGKTPLFLELKSHWDGNSKLAEKTAQLIENKKNTVAVMSFDPILIKPSLYNKKTPRGLVADRFNEQEWPFLSAKKRFCLRHFLYWPSIKPNFIAYDQKSLPTTETIFTQKVLKKPVLSWTVRSQEIAKCIAPYCDQIIFENYRP
jgi:glycerophosphoryl diester phosphodiesterase